MKDVIRQVLRSLINMFGESVFYSTGRFKSALADLLAGSSNELVRNLLNTAVGGMKVYERLKSSLNGNIDIDVYNMTKEMNRNYGIQEDMARVVIECIAELLGYKPSSEADRPHEPIEADLKRPERGSKPDDTQTFKVYINKADNVNVDTDVKPENGADAKIRRILCEIPRFVYALIIVSAAIATLITVRLPVYIFLGEAFVANFNGTIPFFIADYFDGQNVEATALADISYKRLRQAIIDGDAGRLPNVRRLEEVFGWGVEFMGSGCMQEAEVVFSSSIFIGSEFESAAQNYLADIRSARQGQPPAPTPSPTPTPIPTATVTVDGAAVRFGQPPAVISGNTMAVIEPFAELIGADVYRGGGAEAITLLRGDISVTLQSGSNQMTVRELNTGTIRTVYLDVPPRVINGFVHYPIEQIASVFGCNVDWNPSARTVAITTPVNVPVIPPNIAVNGIAVEFSQPPVIVDGNTLAVIDPIAEMLGIDVVWNENTRTITLLYGNISVELQNENPRMTVRELAAETERTVYLSVRPRAIRGYLHLPVEEVAGTLGFGMSWDYPARTVNLSTP